MLVVPRLHLTTRLERGYAGVSIPNSAATILREILNGSERPKQRIQQVYCTSPCTKCHSRVAVQHWKRLRVS